MNYKESYRALTNIILLRDYISPKEWNEYANKNHFFSAIIMRDKAYVNSWDELIENIRLENYIRIRIERAKRKADDKLQEKVEEKREVLHQVIEQHGLHHKVTRKVSDDVNKIINKYYTKKHDKEYPNSSIMYEEYKNSYTRLKELTRKLERFPMVEEWHEYAKENNCLCSESIKYISNLGWHKLRNKINIEKNYKKF